jgi:hypothetical protein
MPRKPCLPDLCFQSAATAAIASSIGGVAVCSTRRTDDGATPGHQWITASSSLSLDVSAQAEQSTLPAVLKVIVAGELGIVLMWRHSHVTSVCIFNVY